MLSFSQIFVYFSGRRLPGRDWLVGRARVAAPHPPPHSLDTPPHAADTPQHALHPPALPAQRDPPSLPQLRPGPAHPGGRAEGAPAAGLHQAFPEGAGALASAPSRLLPAVPEPAAHPALLPCEPWILHASLASEQRQDPAPQEMEEVIWPCERRRE